MSQETKSPGMKAADQFADYFEGRRDDVWLTDDEKSELASIIERETGVTELRQQTDALAKALEVASGALTSAAHYGGMFGSQLGDKYREASNAARAALATYKRL